jgi:threonine dehydrogenase-like Zn-dependent dehydrogenase
MSVPKVVAVIGAGTMGPGMAAVLARAGSEVRLYDISDEILERAKGTYQMATGAAARLIVGSVGSVPFAADTAALAGDPGGFGARAGACAEQAAAGCAPLPDGEASPDYLRHLVAVYARQALVEAFSAS